MEGHRRACDFGIKRFPALLALRETEDDETELACFDRALSVGGAFLIMGP